MKKWTVKKSKVALDASPFMIVRQEECLLPSGLTIPDYNVISEPDIVIAFVLTEDNEVVLVEQYKHGIGEICLEVPGGLSDGGAPLDEVKREISEETGYESDNWEHLQTYINNPTRINNRIYAYIARDAKKVTEQHLDPAEEITVHTLSIEEVLEAIQTGKISAVHSIAMIFHALNHLKT
ncbi:MAG: NUDIX hydrolase [Phototrophicaceae bacterium]